MTRVVEKPNELKGEWLPATCWIAQCSWPPGIPDWVLCTPPFETKAQADVALAMAKARASVPWPAYRVTEFKPHHDWRVFSERQCPCFGDRPFGECHGLGIWTNGTDWVVASSAAHATEVMIAHQGGPYDPEDAGPWERLDDNHLLILRDEDVRTGPPARLTCRQWVERTVEHGLHGFLGSTEY